MGGLYNPIIPVFQDTPSEWKPRHPRVVETKEIWRGYIRFFEPDVYVEAEQGLLERAGLGQLRAREHSIHRSVLTMDEFLEGSDHRQAEPRFGLSIYDVLKHRYQNERRFQLRDPHGAILVASGHGDGIAEALFGTYLDVRALDYLRKGYRDVFQPTEHDSSPSAWREVYERGAVTPLRLTKEGLEARRYWHHDIVIYFFDPTKSTDLIDLWNMRLEPNPVVPVPISWIDQLKDSIATIVKEEHQPVRGNPDGLMHKATMEFGRSIPDEQSRDIANQLMERAEKGTYSAKFWRNPVWQRPPLNGGPRYERLLVSSQESDVRLHASEGDEITTEFRPLAPPFAEKYGGDQARWANVVTLSGIGRHDIATTLPFNTFSDTSPNLGLGTERIGVSTEGWVFLQQYMYLSQSVRFPAPEEMMISWLASYEIRAELSEPGRIARDILRSVDGVWGLSLLADAETLSLLNKMAGGTRRRTNEVDETLEHFENRSATISDWEKLIRTRMKSGLAPRMHIRRFTEANVIRLGLESTCLHCGAKNWRGLDDVNYGVRCDRCLREYSFPQNIVGDGKPAWKYRVIGPYAVPDFARGAYAALLAVRALDSLHTIKESNTLCTALNLTIDGQSMEIDFAMWVGDGRRDDVYRDVRFLVGEAKSFGEKSITARDLERLRTIGNRIPGTAFVIAVMKDAFDAEEQALLTAFCEWAREPDGDNEPRHPVVLLTSQELFTNGFIESEWKERGDPYRAHAQHFSFSNLRNFGDATQAIHLKLPNFYNWLATRRKKTAGIAKPEDASVIENTEPLGGLSNTPSPTVPPTASPSG